MSIFIFWAGCLCGFFLGVGIMVPVALRSSTEERCERKTWGEPVALRPSDIMLSDPFHGAGSGSIVMNANGNYEIKEPLEAPDTTELDDYPPPFVRRAE